MQIKAAHSPFLDINAPDWFEEEEFKAWLNNPPSPLMTWHKQGAEPNEWSDVIVLVDPSLNGEGDQCDCMPDKYWAFILEECRKHFTPSTGFHVIVRITNLGE